MRLRYHTFIPVLFLLCTGTVHAQKPPDGEKKDAIDELFPASGNFLLDIGFGGGTPFSINSRGPGIIMRAPRVQETDNLAAVTVDGEYRFSERFTAGFQVPLGAVAYIDKNDHLLGIYDHYRFGIGDVTAWASTAILRETATRPLLTAVASVDSGSSRYSSLGDGFASCGLGVTGYKSLTSRFYVTGEATAIKRFAKDGLDPGILAVPGLGGGLLTPKGNYRIEVVSEYLWSSKASSEPGEVGGSKLSLSVRLRGAATRYSLQVDIFGFDHLSRGGYGFSLNYPLYPREKFRS